MQRRDRTRLHPGSVGRFGTRRGRPELGIRPARAARASAPRLPGGASRQSGRGASISRRLPHGSVRRSARSRLASRHGGPAEGIVDDAADADLIVMSTQGAGGGGRLLFGSVADRVARHAPAPTLLLRGGHHPVATQPVQRIVVALDGSLAAERALPLATLLATLLHVPVHFVTVDDAEPSSARTALWRPVRPSRRETGRVSRTDGGIASGTRHCDLD